MILSWGRRHGAFEEEDGVLQKRVMEEELGIRGKRESERVYWFD